MENISCMEVSMWNRISAKRFYKLAKFNFLHDSWVLYFIAKKQYLSFVLGEKVQIQLFYDSSSSCFDT